MLGSFNLNFPCDSCGLCCRKVGLVKELKHLDRGDGACIHLEEKTHRCRVYENRPLLCNIRRSFQEIYSDTYSWNEFVRLNTQGCETLKTEHLHLQSKNSG